MQGKTLRARFKMFNSSYLHSDSLVNIEMHENVLEAVVVVVGWRRREGQSHQSRRGFSESTGSPDKDPTILSVDVCFFFTDSYRDKKSFYEGR